MEEYPDRPVGGGGKGQVSGGGGGKGYEGGIHPKCAVSFMRGVRNGNPFKAQRGGGARE